MKIISKTFFLLILCTLNAFSQNFTNGDFESGGNNVGFIIDGQGYSEILAPYTVPSIPGNYSITTDPKPMNPTFFYTSGDHTTGSGKMLVIDGNTVGGQQRFYKAGNNGSGVSGMTIGKYYIFSYWVKSVSSTVTNITTQSDLGIQFNNAINVTLESGSKIVPLPSFGWVKVVYKFQATQTTVNIELWNNNTELAGNDFAIDDLSLIEAPVPFSLTYSYNNPSCSNSTDGSIVAYGIGGVSPYTNYKLIGSTTVSNSTGIFSNVTSGTYTIEITDSAGTKYTQTNIVINALNDLILSPNASICKGSNTTLNVSGSTSGYTWNANPIDPTLTNPNAISQTVSPTTTTVYTVISNPSASSNLIFNGDFSAGNSGFSSNYDYKVSVTPPGQQRTYGITNNAATWYSGYNACKDHTTGTGNFMVVDGSAINMGNDKVWYQTVPVNSGESYTFSYWVNSMTNSIPVANVEVRINGFVLGSQLSPSTACTWSQVSYIWNSGASTTALIEIYDKETSTSGNNFGLDDISFIGTPKVCNLSKSATVTVNDLNLIINNPPVDCTLTTVDITKPTVTAGTTTGTTFTYWQNSIGTIPLSNPAAISTSGIYYIKGVLGACNAIKPVVVTVSTGSAPKPVVVTPVYYCQNSAPVQLTATALPGATLNWYGTDAIGGTASSIAPSPPTSIVGKTTYYVSQTVGICESPRASIEVNIVANTGEVVTLFCDGANSTLTTAAFDWNNVTGYQGYYYSYSVAGGPAVTGFQVSPSHFDVPVPGPGTLVTFTILSVKGLPCVPSVSRTCNSKCATTITPVFPSFGPICYGSTPIVLPTTSTNGITGTWSPTPVSNAVSGKYTFTPDYTQYPCAIPVTTDVVVTPLPNAGTITGNQNICVGLTTTFTSTTPGGTWTSSDTSIATVNSITGVINGISSGTATITYTVKATNGCTIDAKSNRTVSVFPAPNAGTISGVQNICTNATTVFATTSSGGTWSSDKPAIATVDASGLVSGISAGTAIISYTVVGSGGCPNAVATRTITVTKAPTTGTLSGNQTICQNATSTFSSTSTGGTWSSSQPTIASINATSGLVTGISSGTATMTYLVIGTGGCSDVSATRDITVSIPANAGTISGVQNICTNSTTVFSTTSSGGTWSSDKQTIATVDATGLVSGVSAGTAIILYTVNGSEGCPSVVANRTITITKAPTTGTLSGNQTICQNANSTFSSTSTGGTWSSSQPTIASINATSGLVTGISSGTATMTYLVIGTGGCSDVSATRDITVSIPANAGTISGVQNICTNATTVFATTSSGGTWSSDKPAIATVDASGLVSGISAGTAIISYTVVGTGGCSNAVATRTVTVTKAPTTGTLSGNQTICQNATSTFSSTSTGGTWSSSQPAIATINATSGLVTGISGGTTTMTYLVIGTGGCSDVSATRDITVSIPANAGTISGVQSICQGESTLFTTSSSGGSWSSSNTEVATIDAVTGNATTLIGGTTTINYTVVGNGGCPNAVASKNLNVEQQAIPDFEDIDLCSGETPPSLSNTSPNGIIGTWSPSTIDNTASGTYVFTPNSNQCAAAQSIQVNVNQSTLKKVDWTVTSPFSENQVITIYAYDLGNYSYQLDNGFIQTSNIFENVTAGLHSITVYDINGCSEPITINEILVVGYPKFFTPNGDGYNDTWNIFSLSEQSNSKIFIFNRYGKLLKQIDPRGNGWDGTYNGALMPSSDYWFNVEYLEDNVTKVFRSHFTLKR